jgi:hypothetical protein
VVFNGLIPYLNATKRTLWVRLFFIAIRAMWLKVTKPFRPG